MVTCKIRNPERLKEMKGNRGKFASSMLIISEFTSFSQQVEARSAVVISSTFRVTKVDLKYYTCERELLDSDQSATCHAKS